MINQTVGRDTVRVLIINLRIGTGSVGRIVSDLYHGIIESGNECKVAYARGGIGDLPIEDTIKICSDFEVNKHAALTRLFGNTAFWSKKSTNIFLKKVDQFDPDIIHIHGLYGYYINMEVLFKYIKEHNIQLISTLHSCWDFTGHCCYFDYVKCEQWKTGCKNCMQKSSYPKSSFLENTEKNYIRKKEYYDQLKNVVIVSPSNWLAKLAKESFLSSKEIYVIPNGIDLCVFNKNDGDDSILKKYGIHHNKQIILGVASIWDRRKGLDDFIELSEIVDDSIQIVVVGLSKNQIDNLPNKIIGIERTENIQQLVALYTSAEVLFNPTYEDNYPTVNLESIACGTPVVTYDTGGSGEIVKQLNFGTIINKKDYKKLINYVKTNNSHDENINLDIISNSVMSSNYLTLYEKLN